MQGAMGFLICAFNCKFTKESCSASSFFNQLRFDRIMVMSLWPTFLAHPVEVDGKLGGNIRTDGRTTQKRNSSGLIC